MLQTSGGTTLSSGCSQEHPKLKKKKNIYIYIYIVIKFFLFVYPLKKKLGTPSSKIKNTLKKKKKIICFTFKPKKKI